MIIFCLRIHNNSHAILQDIFSWIKKDCHTNIAGSLLVFSILYNFYFICLSCKNLVDPSMSLNNIMLDRHNTDQTGLSDKTAKFRQWFICT